MSAYGARDGAVAPGPAPDTVKFRILYPGAAPARCAGMSHCREGVCLLAVCRPAVCPCPAVCRPGACPCPAVCRCPVVACSDRERVCRREDASPAAQDPAGAASPAGGATAGGGRDGGRGRGGGGGRPCG